MKKWYFGKGEIGTENCRFFAYNYKVTKFNILTWKKAHFKNLY